MRIGCLQFAPQVGDLDNNLNRADAILNKADPEDLDLLVLPELAFTGYNFKSLREISPFLEPTGAGITSVWARTTALKYNCKVVVGYPESADVTENWPTSVEYYNSAIIVNEDGDTCGHYRKSHLYYTDESWALEGPGFFSGSIDGIGDVAMGICMDINPYKFEAPWNAYEFAFHVLDKAANVVILSMAWLTREDAAVFSCQPREPDMETLTYWVTRLEPLIRAETDGEIIVILANRTGVEGDAVYAGTSAVLGIHNGEVTVYGMLGRGDKDLLVVDTSEAAFAKLVYRPDEDAHEDAREEPAVAGSERSDRAKRPDKDDDGSDSSRASREPPSSSEDQPDVAADLNLNTHRSAAMARSSLESAAIPTSDVLTPTSMEAEAPISPHFVWNEAQAGSLDNNITEQVFPDQQTLATSRRISAVDHEASPSGSRVGESSVGAASPGHRHRHRHRNRRSSRDPQHMPRHLSKPTWNANADSDTHQNTTRDKISPSRSGSISPNLEKLGADLMIFEGERTSRSQRDSLICHVDEDDFIVMRRDSMPIREQQTTGEQGSRNKTRQQVLFREDERSRPVSKTTVAPSTQRTELKDANSLRSGAQAQVLKSPSHGRRTPQVETPLIGASRQRKVESTYLPVNSNSPFREEASALLTHPYQAGKRMDSKHADTERGVDRQARQPSRTTDMSNPSSTKPLAIRSKPSVDLPILFSIDALNAISSPNDLPSGTSTPKSGPVVKEDIFESMPPTPKAMTIAHKHSDGDEKGRTRSRSLKSPISAISV